MTKNSIRRVSQLLLATVLWGCSEATSPTTPPAPPSLVALNNPDTAAAWRFGDLSSESATGVFLKITSMTVGTTTVDRYSFTALRRGTDVLGYFYLYQVRTFGGLEEAIVVAAGPVTCYGVHGNKARVGGRIDYTTFPDGLPKGSELTWSVTDNRSTRTTDTASQLLGNVAAAYCAAGLAYPERPIERGDVIVTN